jgi:site-specific recombinase XerC
MPAANRKAASRSSSIVSGPWLESFWSDSSAYIMGKRARGDSISALYIKNNTSVVRRFYSPELGTQPLGRITTANFEAWVLGLYQQGLGPRTVNSTLQAVSVGFREAARIGMIKANPAAGVRPVKENPAVRGILTLEEAKSLFAIEWTDNRARTASFLAAATGMRLGEIRGLLIEDLGLDDAGADVVNV